jgi:hypothetical protein
MGLEEFREGPRTATIKVNTDYNKRLSLQKTTAIAQTCKTLYQKTQGLVVALNIIDFDIYRMHDDIIPRRCKDESDGSNRSMKAVSEASSFWYSFVLPKQQPNPFIFDFTFSCLRTFEDTGTSF